VAVERAAGARYTLIAIALHWSIAALIVLNLVIGWTFRSFEPEARRAIMNLHRSVGLTVLMLTLLRIAWRLSHRPPPLPGHLTAFERWAARAVHLAFYTLLLAIPLAGWTLSSAWRPPRPIGFWGAPFPPLPLPAMSDSVAHQVLNGAAIVHEKLGWALAALLLLHLLAALKHQWVDRDNELGRMIPGLTHEMGPGRR
jgi:cytochrome b561